MWYAMQVLEGQEQACCDLSNAQFGKDGLASFFVPQSIYRRRQDGVWQDRQFALVREHVFVRTEDQQKLADEIGKRKEIVSLLRTGKLFLPVMQQEWENLVQMMDESQAVPFSQGIILDGQLYVEKGPLLNRTADVTKILRHQRFANLEIPLFQGKIEVTVGLEVSVKLSGEEFLERLHSEDFVKGCLSKGFSEAYLRRIAAERLIKANTAMVGNDQRAAV